MNFPFFTPFTPLKISSHRRGDNGCAMALCNGCAPFGGTLCNRPKAVIKVKRCKGEKVYNEIVIRT